MEFEISVAFSTQSYKRSITWNLSQINLSVSISPRNRPLIDESNVDSRDMSEEVATVNLQTTTTYDESEQILDLQYERSHSGVSDQSTAETHLWLVTFNIKTKRSIIEDLKYPGQSNIWDRETSTELNQMLDAPADSLLRFDQKDQLLKHYIERMLVKNRFRPGTLYEVIRSKFNVGSKHL